MYNTIVVNGYEVSFRFRDQDRIKVADVKEGSFYNIDNYYEGNCMKDGHSLDDCTGEEFAKFLQYLLNL